MDNLFLIISVSFSIIFIDTFEKCFSLSSLFLYNTQALLLLVDVLLSLSSNLSVMIEEPLESQHSLDSL